MARIAYTVKQIGIGAPDYSPVKPPGQIIPGPIYTLADMGELAVRLGSIVTFDRRGNVLWMDNFESGIEGWEDGSGDGNHSFSWNPTYHRSGGFCAKLTTDDDTDDNAFMLRRLPYPTLSKNGFEYSFINDIRRKEQYIRLDHYDGDDLLRGYLRWTQSTRTWAYYTGTSYPGSWVDLAPVIKLEGLVPIFHTIKLVCDFENGEYVRLLVNDTVYDMSGIPLYSVGAGDSPQLVAYIMAVTDSDHATNAYIDDVIITQNEP